MTPQELEHLVLLAGDASKSQNQWEATRVLTKWLENPDNTIVSSLIELLKSTQKESVTFFALTTLQRADMNLYEQRVELRTLLMSLIQPLPKHLQIKVGVVLAKLIQQDFVSSWHSAFDELLQTNPSVYLRTLEVLFEGSYEGVDSSMQGIKDVLRGMSLSPGVKGVQIPIEQTISAQIMQRLTTLLIENKDSDLNALTLNVIKRMVCWIDLSLIMNETVVSLLFQALQHEVDSAVIAMGCFSELVGRGMDMHKKAVLLQEAKILEHVVANVNLKELDASPIEVVIEVATFVNTTGLELVEAWEQNQLAEAFWHQILDLFFLCFSYDDIDVSGAVIPFANRLAVNMEKENKPSQNLLSQIILITYKQMKYPSDFQFDYEDEVEAEEEVYRTELRKLNQRLIRADPEPYLTFIGEVLSSLPHPISTSQTADVEVALRLVYHYCEGIRPSPGLKVVMKNSAFRAILCALHRSDITSHTHREILLLYYDLAVRYATLFLEEKELLTHLLVPLSGDRGLQHEHHRVRSRSCYFLLKLVKGLSKVMKEYVETAVTGIHNLISNPTHFPLKPDDSLYLFETIGILLGKTGLNEQQQQQSLTMVMAPHVQKIEKLLSTTDPNVSLDPNNYGDALSESVAAIAYLSKGFKAPPESVQIVLAETLNISLAVLRRLPSHELVRKNCAIVWQRMAICLKSKVLPMTPAFLQLEIEYCTSEDLVDAAQIMNQCCMKFKQHASPALDEALFPFLKKCHSLIPIGGNGEVPPQLKSEQLAIKKLMFNVPYQIVSNGATNLLVSPQNSGGLKDILKIMSDGAISNEDPTTTKTCISFFRIFLQQLDQQISEGGIERNLLSHIYDELIPGLLESISNPAFDGKDAMQARILHEFAHLLISIKSTRGVDEFQQAVLQRTLHHRGCPVSILEAYQVAVEVKQMQRCLEETLNIV